MSSKNALKSELSQQRRIALHDITSRMPGFSCQGPVGNFLDHYLVAESLATRLQNYYLLDSNQSETDKILVNQLCAAHRRFALSFEEGKLRSLFLGGSGERGAKTARQLRNGYLHSLSTADRAEIEHRSTFFLTDLKAYINIHIQTIA